LQETCSISQPLRLSAGTYTLQFKAAQRGDIQDTFQTFRADLKPAIPMHVISGKTFVWSGNTIAEERDSTGASVTKRFFAEGEQRVAGVAGNYYYTRDHLGSIREVTGANGVLQGQYDYDAWGNSVVTKGKMQVDFGYTGHYFHQPSALNLALYRAYSPNLGRWLSRDPLPNPEMSQGANLYDYVYNSPSNYVDPDGLWGVGVTGVASVEAGAIYGGAGTVAAGGGVFGGGTRGVNVGGYATRGAFVGGPGLNKKWPDPCQTIPQPPIVGGAYGGYGRGLFLTNAKSASALTGPFWQWNFNLGVGPVRGSVSFAYNGGIGILSITVGQGGFITGSGYPTTTITTH
jgi:RHS repeat-associated protein